MTQRIQHQLSIPETFAGQRLDQAVAKLLPDYSRSQLKTWIEAGVLTVNGQQQKPRYKVAGGEAVHLDTTIAATENWQAQAIPLDIVYEDDDLLVINKPAGLVVHPGAGNPDNTLVNALLNHIPELADLPRAGVVHRLDKDTTGLLVVAKNLAARKSLIAQLQDRSMSREYDAVVDGNLTAGFTIKTSIGRHPKQRTKMAVLPEGAGKEAITHVRVVEKFRQYTLIRAKLETGRTHQIRVHLAHRRHALVGDPVYGSRLKLPPQASDELIHCLRNFKRQALHARKLSLVHPTTGKIMSWEVKRPADMEQLIRLLRENATTLQSHNDFDDDIDTVWTEE